ncbi:hypothetical protein AN641_06540 [Candidatus Epulonipiscioides gigas]|nr:hypothetical protein AN641_06540 [Epulopiscium sp. SCG-C07WGA-EpuloA2]
MTIFLFLLLIIIYDFSTAFSVFCVCSGLTEILEAKQHYKNDNKKLALVVGIAGILMFIIPILDIINII